MGRHHAGTRQCHLFATCPRTRCIQQQAIVGALGIPPLGPAMPSTSALRPELGGETHPACGCRRSPLCPSPSADGFIESQAVRHPPHEPAKVTGPRLHDIQRCRCNACHAAFRRLDTSCVFDKTPGCVGKPSLVSTIMAREAVAPVQQLPLAREHAAQTPARVEAREGEGVCVLQGQ